VILAILELRNANGDGFGALAGEFLDFLQFLAELACVLDFRDDFFRDLFVAIEEVEKFFADAIDEFSADFGVAEFVFGLRFEDGVFQANGDCADHAFADVVAFEFLLPVLVDGFQEAFAECAEVRAAVAGVLAIDEGIKAFAETAVAVSEAEFEGLFGVMQRRIDGLTVVGLEIFHDEVEQAVAGLEGFAVVDELEAGVEVAVMAQAALDVFRAKFGFFEDGRVGFEFDERAVGFGVLALLFVLELALFEEGFDELAFAMAADEKFL
jgi:hypothetical protein